MITGQPSRTALATAAARAAHLIVDTEPWIFRDPLAAVLLGSAGIDLIAEHRDSPTRRVLVGLRAETACRARYTEDRLAEAADGGITQYIVLGAGLDTFAYRSPMAEHLRVFEVDHPATQTWKRQALAAAGIKVGQATTFVPVDLRSQPLLDRLVTAGLDPRRPAFVACLGLSMYLPRAAITTLLTQVRALAAGSELVIEYALPRKLLDRDGRSFLDAVLPMAAVFGEPWYSQISTDDLSTMLERNGFTDIRTVAERDMVDATLWQRRDALRPMGATAIAQARVVAR